MRMMRWVSVYVEVCCSVLQCIVVCCSLVLMRMMRCVSVYVEVCCNVLQCIAVYWSVLLSGVDEDDEVCVCVC